MPVIPFTELACPLDGQPLRREGGSWLCAAGHCHDIAREGHVHLLPVQHKRSLDPGDSKLMVAARRRFLSAGHYEPIAAAVNRLTLEDLPAAGSCLDAGCGEGHYLGRLASAVGNQRTLALLGLDISKWAVQAAARREAGAAWVVGSNARLPVLSGTLDRVLCMFGFPVYPEFARVLRQNGRLIQIDAGPAHLRELREIIYPVLKPEKPADETPPDGFIQRTSERLEYPLAIEGQEAIADLLAMTPHLYRASPEGRARAAALDGLTLTVDVRLTVFQPA